MFKEMVFNMRTIAKGLKDDAEAKWARKLAFKLYNIFSENSEYYWAGFNELWREINHGNPSALLENGEINPEYDRLANIFAKGIQRTVAKKNGGVRNNLIVQLNGIDAILLNEETGTGIIKYTVENMD